MQARINQGVVEGLATMGLGHRVDFIWEQWAFDATHAANCLDVAGLRLARLPDESDEELLSATIGLALIGVQAHGATEWRHWPEGGLQREALACLELGSASKVLLQKMPYMRDKVVALQSRLVDRFDSEGPESDRLLQCLLLGSLELSLGLAASNLWAEQSAGVRAVISFLERKLPLCNTTLERADLVRQLVPPEVPSALPQGAAEENKSSAEEGSAGKPSEPSTAEGTGGSDGKAMGGETTHASDVADVKDVQRCDGKTGSAAEGACATGEDRSDGDAPAAEPSPDSSAARTDDPLSVMNEVSDGQTQPGNALATEADDPVSAESPTGEEAVDVVQGLQGIDPEAVEGTNEEDGMLLVELGAGGSQYASEATTCRSETLNANIGRVLSALLRVFQDKRKRKVGVGHAGTRVAPHRFWRLKSLGDTKIFKNPADRCGHDMAVEVLLDRSSSMGNDPKRMRTAKEVTMALALAFSRMMGVKVAVDMFPGVYGPTESILQFGGHLGRAQLAMDAVYADGGTPLGQAIDKVRPGLLAQSMPRKIIVIITDGRPDKRELAKQELDMCREAGIEVFALGIRVDVSELVPQSIAIKEAEELPEAVVTLFSSIMDQALA